MQGPHGDTLISARCRVAAFENIGGTGAAGWRTARYQWVSVFTADADAKDKNVIIFGLLALAVFLCVVALRTPWRGGQARAYLAISVLPLLMTLVAPVPFGLVTHGPTDWARQTVVTVSRAGIALSVILVAIGVALTLRALRVGDHRTATLLAIETALAGIPAAMVAVYAALFYQW